MDGKKLAILATIIIVLGVIVGVVLPQKSKPTQVNGTDKNAITNSIESKNTIENNTTENVIDNTIENTVENTVETENKITPTTANTEKPKTDEEKAIDIAKKDFINSNTNLSSIDFSVEDRDGKGRYIVAVRNSTTTEVLAFYHVDVANSTFIKE